MITEMDDNSEVLTEYKTDLRNRDAADEALNMYFTLVGRAQARGIPLPIQIIAALVPAAIAWKGFKRV